MLIGYARVSTDEQSLGLQLDALKAAGCKRIFPDKVFTTRADHPGLADALSHLRHAEWLPEKSLKVSAFRSQRCTAGYLRRVGEPFRPG